MAEAPAVDEILKVDDAARILEELLDAQNKAHLLGLKLHVHPRDVEAIQTTYQQPTDRLLHIILAFLRQSDIEPTWRVIIDALRSPVVNLPHLATRLKRAHFPDPTAVRELPKTSALVWSPDSQIHQQTPEAIPDSGIESQSIPNAPIPGPDYSTVVVPTQLQVAVADLNQQQQRVSSDLIIWSAAGESLSALAISSHEVKEMIERLEKHFNTLKKTIRENLEEKKVAVTEVADILTSLSPDDDDHHKVRVLVTAVNHSELFGTMNFHWNYLDPSLLDNLVRKLDLQEVKTQMETYKTELRQFRMKTPLTLFCRTQKRKRIRLSPEFREIVAVFDWNNDKTLEDVEQFRQEYASHYKLHEFAMMIAQVFHGSFIITWFIPESVVQKLKVNLPISIFKKYLIHKLEIDGNCVYPKPQVAAVMLSTSSSDPATSVSSEATPTVSSLSAIDKYLFVEEPPDDMFCPVTYDLLLKPHLTSCCGNHLSEEAATRIQGETGVCPLCKSDSWSTVLNKHFQREVKSLPVFCNHGCGWQRELSNLNHHVESCVEDGPLTNKSCVEDGPIVTKIPTDLENIRETSKDFPVRTALQTAGMKSTRPSIFEQPLDIGNYHQRFCELLKLEEDAHLKLLRERCDGKYVLFLYQAGQTPEKVKLVNMRYNYDRIGYLKSMGCDEVAYATQSAIYAVIELGECSIQCDILRENMNHAEERLYVGFKKEALQNLLSHFNYKGKELGPLPVHFQLKFPYFRVLKESVRNMQKGVISRILPSSASFFSIDNTDNPLLALDKSYCSPNQYEALKVIASTPASGPPVLISGPCGTGKTRVLAVAAHYLLRQSILEKSRLAILVCTQQQTLADAYVALYDSLTKAEEKIMIVRLVPTYFSQTSRYMKSVHDFKRGVRQTHFESQRYLIVTTCLTARHIANFLPPRFFTHIFLDEGAQMREPEAIAPLCMANQSTKIVITGDKYQVEYICQYSSLVIGGPRMLVLGEEPQRYGLSISLLERLYDHYQELGDVAKPYCAHLTTNFRCHSAILNLAREVAYKTPLVCNMPNHSAHPDAPFPLRFVCTSLDHNVKETKDSICKVEVDAALEEASRFFMKWPVSNWGQRDLKQICFLSPCRAQVTLSNYMRERNLPPQVKMVQKIATYNIQGQEFRALFISTSEPTTPEGETRDSTKSISDPAVFITAITRARSLVVAVGNPFMLLRREQHMVKKYGDRGHCWSLFLKACIDHGTLSVYKGEPSDKHNKVAAVEILKKMIYQQVSHLRIPEDSYDGEKVGSSTSTVPEILTEVVQPSAPDDNAPKEAKFHEFRDHEYEDVLGQGGFGVVCCVRHKVDKKKYAVKIVRLHDKPEEEKYEVGALADLDHPNIVRYYDSWKARAPPNWQSILPWKHLAGSESHERETTTDTTFPDSSATLTPYTRSHLSEDSISGFELRTPQLKSSTLVTVDPKPPLCLFIRTELCERETLKKWLEKNKNNRKRNQITPWFMEMLEGVRYIHSQGRIHRDLKPSNIFFSFATTTSGKRIKIGDFGLVTTSQVVLSEAASKSAHVGSSYYISPEQLLKEKYGKEVDIYALGIIFFEMNCPFSNEIQRLKHITGLRNKGSFPKGFRDYLHHEAKVIEWMLTEDPERRPSAEEICSSETMKRLQKSSRKSKASLRRL